MDKSWNFVITEKWEPWEWVLSYRVKCHSDLGNERERYNSKKYDNGAHLNLNNECL